MTQQTRLGKPVLNKSVEETNQSLLKEKGDGHIGKRDKEMQGPGPAGSWGPEVRVGFT